MKKFPIALQLFSVRDDMAANFEGTLKKVKELGYDGVEFAGLFGKGAAEVKKICKEIGLVPISAHVSFVDMMNDPDLLNIYAEIGCEYIVIATLAVEYRPGSGRFGEIIESIKKLGMKANELGMKLAYHNHDYEFNKIDGEYALDIIYKEVPAEFLEAQLDTCWVNVGGENPAEYVSKYAGRVETLHLKDFVGCRNEKMYAFIGVDEDKKKDTQGKFELRPVGSGLQDFPAILKAAEKAGTKWVIVEQDNPSMGLTSIECAQKSINYLKSL